MKYGIIFKNKYHWIDLCICSVWLWSILGARDAWNSPIELFSLIAVFMRINSAFILRRNEVRAWIPLGIMSCCLGLLVGFQEFPGLDTMVRYPFILNGIDQIQDKGYTLIATPIIIWLWGLPIIIYLILLFRKKLKRTDLSYKNLFGSILWQDHTAKFYSILLLVSICALYSGLAMDARFCRFACLTLPVITYWYLCKYYDVKKSRIELIIISMVIFHFSQSFYGIMRVSMLVISLSIPILLSLNFYQKTLKVLPSIVCGVYIGVFLPSLCIGYNIYTCIDYGRIGFFSLAPYNGIFLIKDHSEHRYGLRDRYNILIEPYYTRIKAHKIENIFWYRYFELWQDEHMYLYDIWENKLLKGPIAEKKGIEHKENEIAYEERIVNRQEDLKAYFDSLCKHTKARLWIHRPDDSDTIKVWNAIDELNKFARGERMTYPGKEVSESLSLMWLHQAYLESHGAWLESSWNNQGFNPGEIFIFHFLKKATLYCPRIEDLTDIYSEDKKVGVINLQAWGDYALMAVVLFKDGKSTQIEFIKDKYAEISHITKAANTNNQYYLHDKRRGKYNFDFSQRKIIY